jgi:lipopolysaccharide export system protein LptC
MQQRESIVYPLVLAGALAAVSFWLQQFVSVRSEPGDTDFRYSPDIIVEDFQARTLDQHGRLEYVLTAKKMSHFPDDEFTSLVKPSLTRMRDGAPPLQLDSEKGLVTNNGAQVYFIGGVHARADKGADPGFSLRSELLQVTPAQNRITTNRTVELIRDGTTIRAGSMDANTQTRIIKLGSRVVAHYELEKK